MKKIFVLLSALLLCVGILPANAMPGVPDDVPGKDILVPFFYVSMPNFGDDNTIITITDVGIQDINKLHWTLYDKSGVAVADNDMSLTAGEVWTIDAYTMIQETAGSNQFQPKLEIDSDGDGHNDHWVGYIYFDNYSGVNNLIAQVYQVNIGGGRAASYNPPRLEHIVGAGLETYPAERLMFRYNILNEKSDNLIIIWTDEENLSTAPTVIHMYDEDANVMSVAIPITEGLNIINLEDYIPYQLIPASSYPKAGWIDLPLDAYSSSTWLGYCWERTRRWNNSKGVGKGLNKLKNIRWDVINAADRELP